LIGVELFRFLIVGTVNTGLTLLLFEGLRLLVPYMWAYSLAYVTGIAISYLLNAAYVFQRPKTVTSAALYPLVYVGQYALGVMLMWVLVENVSLSPALAVLVVILISVPVTFVMSRTILLLGKDSKEGNRA
jgi:putative flippase GtrA